MAEFIDREEVLGGLAGILNTAPMLYIGGLGVAFDCVRSTPAADVVPVVRCKNCVFYQKDPEIAKAMNLEPEIYCAVNRTEMGPDAFCSYGRNTPWLKASVEEVEDG